MESCGIASRPKNGKRYTIPVTIEMIGIPFSMAGEMEQECSQQLD